MCTDAAIVYERCGSARGRETVCTPPQRPSTSYVSNEIRARRLHVTVVVPIWLYSLQLWDLLVY
jgi:hypothetical protein